MVDDNEPPHHELIRKDMERLLHQQPHLRSIQQPVVRQHPNHRHPNDPDAERRVHYGPNGKRHYHHTHSNHHFPASLQIEVQKAHAALEEAHYRQRNTPVPGGPSGGFPGLPNPRQIVSDIRRVRQDAIDKWHAKNPDHEVE